ncbi:hypothetical protein [Paenibacillus radicis (ex Xue et al. 2023)]|uniref:DUF4432 domain-containing protein n=1 Tax=Paenibacillus radicis (ex Xue et al. 2023) TaxID=2972489 RepID=A0ABT1YLR4_9BACL|nr:hypothetical protein [Paenibacillus radicis (ex Xue et al. 2023)]MCR8634121.1 hypothetical protein [Paenibacillus radicis (ex Xue et al. 2023)]
MEGSLYRPLRNSGCRIIDDIVFKGYRSLLLENEKLLVHLLLDKGGEPVRWLHKETDTDFIWFTEQGLSRAQPLYADYQDNYIGGWQEMLPEVSYTSQYRGATVHRGESAVTPWEYQIIKDERDEIQVRLINRIRSMPIVTEKIMTLKSGSGTVVIKETLHNRSDSTELEVNWGHHLAYGFPFLDQESFITLGDAAQIVHPRTGESWDWPKLVQNDGIIADLSLMPAEGTERELLYIRMTEHRYRLTNPRKQVALEVRWDGSVWPYLWYWQNFKADCDAPFYGCEYNIGLEMFNVPPKLTLSEAAKLGLALKVPAGGNISSWLEIEAVDLRKEAAHGC